MEKKNFLLVKTNRGIEKIQLYKSLDEIVGLKEENLTITNSEEISLSKLEKDIIPFVYKIDENAITKKVIDFTYTPSVKMNVFADSKAPPLSFTEDKKIILNIQSIFSFIRKRLKSEQITMSAGELIVNLILANKKMSFSNKEEIIPLSGEKELLINYDSFFPLDINENDFDSIKEYYTKLYGKEWEVKLNKEIAKNINNFISVFYKKTEIKNNVKTKIKNNEVISFLKDNDFEFENMIILPMDIKLTLNQKVLKFGLENEKVLTIDEKYANKELSIEELKTALKEIEITKEQKIEGYILQTIDLDIYKLYKNKISGSPILVNDRYILKTAGSKEKIFRNEYDELFFIERDVENYSISSELFRKNGGVILVCSGAGSTGNGKFGGAGGNGMILRYEIPSNSKITSVILTSKFETGGSNGSVGETFATYEKGENGGTGGKNVIATLNEGGRVTKLIAYGGGGGGGSGLVKNYNSFETKGGIGGRDGNNRKIDNETDNKFGGKGTDANVYDSIELYEKNLDDAKIIIGAYFE
jgi:hypothetical protein